MPGRAGSSGIIQLLQRVLSGTSRPIQQADRIDHFATMLLLAIYTDTVRAQNTVCSAQINEYKIPFAVRRSCTTVVLDE